MNVVVQNCIADDSGTKLDEAIDLVRALTEAGWSCRKEMLSRKESLSMDTNSTSITRQLRVQSIRTPESLAALSHPTRVAMLEVLRDPASAASVGRAIGQPRQRVNHHLKALEAAGLVEQVGRRAKGNFTETLYRSSARSFVVSPQVAWSDPRRTEALQRQHSLQTLVELGDQLQSDAAALLDQATFEGAEISSAAVAAETRFDSESDRAAFLTEYLQRTRELVDKYGAAEGTPYRVVMAVHPQSGTSQSNESE